jgi:hypothetical protein
MGIALKGILQEISNESEDPSRRELKAISDQVMSKAEASRISDLVSSRVV